MEYRDLSRIVAPGEDDGEDAPPRIRRFEFVRSTGRLDVRKLAAAALLTTSILAVLLYVGGRAVSSAVAWLHRQPQYQIPFDGIELLTPPPECFRGGARAFLERVRRNADEAETIPVLDLDPARIERAFKLFPWVEAVESVDFPPRGLSIRLSYREPAAKILLPGPVQFVLDRNGLILPLDDIDLERLGPTVRIEGGGIVPPSSDRFGKLWQTTSAESPGRTAVDRKILQAAHLAGFFLEPSRSKAAESMPSLRILSINITDPRGLFIQNAEDAMLLWGQGPGDEQAGELSAEKKWEILESQAGREPIRPGKPGDYWEFGRGELRFKRIRPG